MSLNITVNINPSIKTIPICWITILDFKLRGRLIIVSIRMINMWPPSRPGTGKIFKNAKFTGHFMPFDHHIAEIYEK